MTSLTEFSKEGYGSKRAVLQMIMMMTTTLMMMMKGRARGRMHIIFSPTAQTSSPIHLCSKCHI
jgi:hypothetical protein